MRTPEAPRNARGVTMSTGSIATHARSGRSRVPGALTRIADGAKAVKGREAITEVVSGFREHGLLIEAGAIAFRLFLALLTGGLCILGLLGFFDLTEVWSSEIAPRVEASVSPPAFKVIDDAVLYILASQQLFWVTAGAALAVWQLSSVVRASGQIMNRIYGRKEDRPLIQELVTSIAAGALCAPLILGAFGAVRFLPLAAEALLGSSVAASVLGGVLGVILALILLTVALGLVLRAGPDVERPLHWVTFGSVLVVIGWALMTLAFFLYLTELASFSSVFGHLTTVFLLAEYLFLSGVVFLGGLLVDSVVQERAADAPS